jgi:hypothetical protein
MHNNFQYFKIEIELFPVSYCSASLSRSQLLVMSRFVVFLILRFIVNSAVNILVNLKRNLTGTQFYYGSAIGLLTRTLQSGKPWKLLVN